MTTFMKIETITYYLLKLIGYIAGFLDLSWYLAMSVVWNLIILLLLNFGPVNFVLSV